jgi:hypothetical protein
VFYLSGACLFSQEMAFVEQVIEPAASSPQVVPVWTQYFMTASSFAPLPLQKLHHYYELV